MAKKFSELKRDDTIYCVSMSSSDVDEVYGSCLRELRVKDVSRVEESLSKLIVLAGTFVFTTSADLSSFTRITDLDDEVDLSFEAFATTKELAVEEAMKTIQQRLNNLELIKKRLNESETGLVLATAALEAVDTTEQITEKEFAEMALC